MNTRSTALRHPIAAALVVLQREEMRSTTPSRPSYDDEFIRQFEQHFQRVRRVIGRLAGDFELADDITQDAFVRLYRRGSLPDAPGQWLITVALNLFRNAAMSRRRRRALLTVARGEAVHSDPAPAPDHSSGASDVRARVRAAMGRVPEREQRMLLLRAEGYSYREIATALDINTGSVGTLLARAKRQFLEAYGDTSDAR